MSDRNNAFRDWVERHQILTIPGGWRAQRQVSPLYCESDGCVPPGWIPLLDDLADDLIELGWNRQLAQTKQKLGGVRFVIYDGTPEMYALIAKAEEASYQICEECGQPGETTKTAWIRTLCRPCTDEYLNRINLR